MIRYKQIIAVQKPKCTDSKRQASDDNCDKSLSTHELIARRTVVISRSERKSHHCPRLTRGLGCITLVI